MLPGKWRKFITNPAFRMNAKEKYMRVEKHYVTHLVQLLILVHGTLPNIIKLKVWLIVPMLCSYVLLVN